jgi:alternate signal-mediated exported protein
MNKLIKGAVATAAGVALLMGGAGTFAYWNDSVGVTGGNITAGTLTVADSGTAGSWTVQKDGTGTAVAVADISTFVASPGDKFSYTKNVVINATGNNLVATLQLAPGSITSVTNTTANNALRDYLVKTASIAVTGAGITAGSVAGTYTITPGTTGISNRTVTVTVVINFPKDAAAGTENATKTGAVSLAGLAVQLNQN